MFAIQIKSLQFTPHQASEEVNHTPSSLLKSLSSFPFSQSKPRNVFIDISSEGQLPRRYFAGRFEGERKLEYKSMVHYTRNPVSIQLSYGPFYHANLGTHTLFDFLHPESSFPHEEVLFFEKRNTMVLRLELNIHRIYHTFQFVLNEATCLNQVRSTHSPIDPSILFFLTDMNPTKASSIFKHDRLWAEVEFNCCQHSVHPGPINNYQLGKFRTQDVGSVYTVNNCKIPLEQSQ